MSKRSKLYGAPVIASAGTLRRRKRRLNMKIAPLHRVGRSFDW